MIAQSIRRTAFLAALCPCLLGVAVGPATAVAAEQNARYIVVFEDTVANPANLARAQVEQRQGRLGFVYRHALKGYSAALPESAVEGLRRNPNVKHVSRDGKVEISEHTVPTGIDRTFATANAGLDIDGEDDLRADVDVAVIDTGIDHGHPDLEVVARADCTFAEGVEECEEKAGADGHSHGTHVAGTIGAIDNSIGVTGMAPGARMWAVKVLGDSGSGTFSWIIAGVDWVTAHAEEIEVANMSLGGEGSQPALDEAIAGSVEAGVVHVVAAGNESSNAANFSPASSPDVITVSALADYDGKAGGEGSPTCIDYGADDTLASFSNFGEAVDVAAPGVCILSTEPGESYGYKSGTSMASPHVAGAAAILAATGNPEDREDVEAIRGIVEDGNFDWEDTSGDGIQEPLLDVSDEAVFDLRSSTSTSFSFAFGEEGTGNGQLKGPRGIAIDSEGNVWVADAQNDRVQKFNAEGEYLAQLGEEGTGNGQLNDPWGIAIDSEGNLWVTDAENDRVQKFNAQGEYLDQLGETGTGNGQLDDPRGIAIDSEGNLWVADAGNDRVQKFNASGEYLDSFGEEGSGDGQFSRPQGLAIDSKGSLWVADTLNNRVQKFNASGEYLDSFGEEGSGDGQFFWPQGLAIDSKGSLWVADTLNNRVQKFNASGEYLDSFGEGGLGDGQFSVPQGIATDADDSLWIADTGNHRVQKWDSTDQHVAITTAASEVTHDSAKLNAAINPNGLATTYQFEYGTTTEYGSKAPAEPGSVGSGSQFVAVEEAIEGLQAETTYHFRVLATSEAGTTYGSDREFTTGGQPVASTTAASEVTDDSATLNATVNPNGVATTYQFEYGTTTEYGSKAPAEAKAIGSGTEAVEVEEAIEGLELGTTYHFRVLATNAAGTTHGSDLQFTTAEAPAPAFAFSFGELGNGNGQFNEPRDTAIDAEGNVWVVDKSNDRVQKFGPGGEYLDQFGEFAGFGEEPGDGDLWRPEGIAIDSEGNLWVADTKNHRLQKFDSQGEYLDQFGEFGSGDGQFNDPRDVAIDAEGNLWVVDAENHRLQKFSPGGEYLDQFGEKGTGDGQLEFPAGMAIDAEGDLWVADTANHRLQKFNAQGEYLDQFGELGEGDAQLAVPRSIAIDAEGNLWVTDSFNGRVKKFSPEGEYLNQFGEFGGGDGQFRVPTAIAIDAEGDLWVADQNNDRVQKWTTADQPAVTLAATEITHNSAKLNATVNPNGLATTYQFEYGTTTEYGSKAPAEAKAIGSGTEAVEVDEAIEGLQAETTYHFRVLATNEAGTTYGSDLQFTTAGPPAATTVAASDVTHNSAKLNATVNPNGLATTYQFEYGTTTKYGSKAPAEAKAIGSGSEAVAVEEAIEGLQAETTYHFRVLAINEAGTTYGSDLQFTTAGPPAATTVAASDVTHNSAKLNATVNPNGLATTYQFEYGTTTKYGSKAPAEAKAIGSGSEAVAVEEAIEGLEPETTYHFRVVGTNEAGTSYGSDLEFTTSEVSSLSFSFAFGEEGTGNGQLKGPRGVALDSEGNVWVVDTENDRVQKFNAEGEYLAQLGEEGAGNGQLNGPWGIAIDSEGNLWVADTANDRVQKFNASGEYLDQFGEEGTGSGQLDNPIAIAIDSEGDLWVADNFNDRVQKFNASGEYLDQFGEEGAGNGQFNGPRGIAIDSAGNLWVVDMFNNRVQKFNAQGEYLDSFGEEGSGDGQFFWPMGIAIDSAGNLWVGDTLNNRVQKFNASGEYLDQFGEAGEGDGQFATPMLGIATGADDSLWVADTGNHRVQKWGYGP